jgi:hypothetical protein
MPSQSSSPVPTFAALDQLCGMSGVVSERATGHVIDARSMLATPAFMALEAQADSFQHGDNQLGLLGKLMSSSGQLRCYDGKDDSISILDPCRHQHNGTPSGGGWLPMVVHSMH